MRICLIIAFLFLFLGGCAYHRGPEDAVHLTLVTEVGSLSGVFLNQGDPSGRLSYIFFGPEPIKDKPSDAETAHEGIDWIKISAIDEGLLVEAITGDCIAADKILREGEDFDVEEGRIVLEEETHLLTRGVGDVTVGPSISKTFLAVDVGGHLIWKRQDYAAVLVGFIIPAAVSDVVEVRYQKANLDENTIFERCILHQ